MADIDITKYVSKYFPYRNVETQNGNITKWLNWYKGYVPEFHEYKIYNGRKKVKLTKKSLRMAKKSCEDWANLLLNENVVIAIKDQEKLDEILYNNGFQHRANNLLETSFALSIGAFVEGLDNATYNENTGKIVKSKDTTVRIDYVNGTKIYPITFKNGVITECAFASKNTTSTEISIHKLNDKGTYTIYNIVVGDDNKETELVFETGSKKPLFQIIQPNVANNDDINSPYSVSIFANAIDCLKAIDNAYDSFDTEIQYGRKRIVVDDRLVNVRKDGQEIDTFDPTDVVFYTLPPKLNGDEKDLIQELSSPLRTNDIANALQEQLNVFSACCGFGKNYYTFGANGGGRPIQTATGIIAQNSDLFRSIRKHELLLEKALKDMVNAIAYLSNEFTMNHIEIGDRIVINFDDSIIEDTEAEKTSDRIDVSNGVMSKVEYRVKWYGEDEEKALENLNKFSLNDLDVRLNALLPALQSGAINVETFVDSVFKNADDTTKNALITSITEQIEKANNPVGLENINLDIND